MESFEGADGGSFVGYIVVGLDTGYKGDDFIIEKFCWMEEYVAH